MLSQRIAVLRKIRRFLRFGQRKLYYNAMIKQTMLYASNEWTSCFVENMQKVFKLQKRTARVILGADTKANSVQLFRKLDWVPIFLEARVNRLLMVYKRLSGDCPSYTSQMLMRNADINERQTWTIKPCLFPLQTGVRGRKVFHSIDHTPLEYDTM